MYGPAMIYFEAGTFMDSDRVATFSNVKVLSAANMPSAYSVEDIARIYLKVIKKQWNGS